MKAKPNHFSKPSERATVPAKQEANHQDRSSFENDVKE
jgi:hypothetical protein